MMARAFSATLCSGGAYAVFVQPDLAIVVTAVALVAEVSISSVLWGQLSFVSRTALALPSLRLGPTDGWMPTCGTGSVPRLILLSQPRR
jgi:hypothetical protein